MLDSLSYSNPASTFRPRPTFQSCVQSEDYSRTSGIKISLL
jgi:hypothetical protein